MLAPLARLMSNPWTERTVMVLIIVNAVILGLETSPTVMAAIGPVLNALDTIILAVFVVEILARMLVQGWAFYRDPWNWFDTVVVAIALVPATGPLQVLRALRILRVLRLITAVPSLKKVVSGLITALPGMGSVVALLALLFYVFAVMATNLYGQDFPQFFGSIGASAYSLFQIMTLEDWSAGIVRPVMEKHPYAWAFFIPYIVVTTFAVLNLFIGIVVNAMQSEHDAEMEAKQEAELAELREEQKPLIEEIRRLRMEVTALRDDIALSRKPAG